MLWHITCMMQATKNQWQDKSPFLRAIFVIWWGIAKIEIQLHDVGTEYARQSNTIYGWKIECVSGPFD